jgi:hypothetical protein
MGRERRQCREKEESRRVVEVKEVVGVKSGSEGRDALPS